MFRLVPINFNVTTALVLKIMRSNFDATFYTYGIVFRPLFSSDIVLHHIVDIALMAPLDHDTLPTLAPIVSAAVLNPAANIMQSFDFHATHMPVSID
jgi:hypothetical protein